MTLNHLEAWATLRATIDQPGEVCRGGEISKVRILVQWKTWYIRIVFRRRVKWSWRTGWTVFTRRAPPRSRVIAAKPARCTCCRRRFSAWKRRSNRYVEKVDWCNFVRLSLFYRNIKSLERKKADKKKLIKEADKKKLIYERKELFIECGRKSCNFFIINLLSIH